MSDNVAIKEGARAYNFTTDKIRTAQQDSDEPVIWVPESTVQLGSLHASDNGVYLAASEDLYGYGEIVVSVNGAATIGDRSVFPDEDGELHEENLPHGIVIVTPPRKIKYEDKQRLDFSGIIVKAINEDGSTWTNAKYPNGHIPLGELLFDPYYADAEKVEAFYYDTADGIHAVLCRKSPFKYLIWPYTPAYERTQWVCVAPKLGEYYVGNPGDVYLTQYNGQTYAASVSGQAYTEAFTENTDPQGQGPQPAPYKQVGGSVSTVSEQFELKADRLYRQYLPESSINPSGRTMDGATPQEGQQTITVYWPRYGDKKYLSTTFGITVVVDDGFSGGSGNF